ncbi:unnamed protein product, partial [Menidia menidia]
GNVSFYCGEPVSVAATFPGPQSFLQLPWPSVPPSAGFTVGFQFRTWNRAGLLLSFGLPGSGGVVWLYLSEARLRLQVYKPGRAELELSAEAAVSQCPWTNRKGVLPTLTPLSPSPYPANSSLE